MAGTARNSNIVRLETELTKRVVLLSVKEICIDTRPFISFCTKNSRSYIAVGIMIPKNFPAIIKIAGVRDILSALFSSFDIRLGQFV